MQPRDVLKSFDAYLAERSLQLDAVVIGGAALNLLGVVSRPTKDCDILHPETPPEIARAARNFAAACRRAGQVLQDDWLNNGPASLAQQLPEHWQARAAGCEPGLARPRSRDDR
jgi:Nucleotidyltransferase of unknown function (DUF6036)